jgi:hypothetical protein
MIAAMSKLTCATTILAFCFAGCGGGESASSGPAKDPSGVDMEFHEPEEETEATESEPAEPEATESESSKEEAAESEAPAPKKEPEPQKSCEGLTQKTCEITVGCAWHTDKKCVQQ